MEKGPKTIDLQYSHGKKINRVVPGDGRPVDEMMSCFDVFLYDSYQIIEDIKDERKKNDSTSASSELYILAQRTSDDAEGH